MADDVDLGRLVTDLPDWEERDEAFRARRRRRSAAAREDSAAGGSVDVDGDQPTVPSERSPTGASPSERSPTGTSPSERSPTGTSPSEHSPTGASPMGASPSERSPTGTSPSVPSPWARPDEPTSLARRTDSPAQARTDQQVVRPADGATEGSTATPAAAESARRTSEVATPPATTAPIDRSGVELDTAPMERVVAQPAPPAAAAGPTRPPSAADVTTRVQQSVRTTTAPVPEQPTTGWVDDGYATEPWDEPTPGRRRRRRRRRSLWKRVLLVLVLVVLLLIGYYGFTLWQVWSAGRADEARPVDAIVVMGAAQYDGRPSPQLAGRLDHAATLWPEGYAPVVVVTGGNQPGDRFTEAEASASYLMERGVPQSAIVLEDAGTTTLESLANVAELLGERGADSVLIVTDPYHALRSRMIAEDEGLEAYVSPTTASVVSGSESITRHLEEAAGVSVGRLIGFDRLSGLTG